MALHVEVAGRGKPLALIHGWGMHGGVWQPVAQRLAQHFQLHIIDLPGMGFSPAIEPENLASIAQAVAAVLPAHSAVCGWSLGGQVAMHMALHHAHKVSRLVLLGTTPKFVNAADWQCGMDAAIFHKFAQNISDDYQATLLRFLSLQCMGAADARHTLKQLRESFAARPVPSPSSLNNALAILLNTDLRAQLAQIQQPTLLIHGERDTLAPAQAAQYMAQALPQCQLHILAGVGHAPFLAQAQTFVDLLLAFLADTASL